MIRWVINQNLSEPNIPLALVLRGVPVTTDTKPSVSVDDYFQFADDPTMEPQFLSKGVPGKTASVPIDLKGRDIIITRISKTEDGKQSASLMEQGEKLFFPAVAVAELESAVYDSGDNETTLTIANNRGTGTIRILRKVGSTDYSEIANIPFDQTTYIDEPPINETYSYKLIQDGQLGESSVKTVVVASSGSPSGSVPSGLNLSYDSVSTVTVSWTNNGGTGDNVIERKLNNGGWADLATVSSATISYDDVLFSSLNYRTFYYRVKNLSVAGYSNEDSVLIERQT